jgi:Cupin superfamily protein
LSVATYGNFPAPALHTDLSASDLCLRPGARLQDVAAFLTTDPRSASAPYWLFPAAGADWLSLFTLADLDRLLTVVGVEHWQFSLLAEEMGLRQVKLFDYVDKLSRLGVPLRLLTELLTRRRSLLLRHIQIRCPGVRAAFNAFGKAQVEIADVVTILSPPNSQATAPHADGRAILQLQLRGRKHWKVWKVIADDVIDRAFSVSELSEAFDRAAISTHAAELTLDPGDMLFLPKRALHTATTGTAFSLSLSFQLAAHWRPLDTTTFVKSLPFQPIFS